METIEYNVQKKLEHVANLVDKFESQSKQLATAEKKLDSATEIVQAKVKEIIDNCKEVVSYTKDWTEKATEEIFDLSAKAGDAFEAIQNALDAENFMDLCEKLRELVSALEECNSLREDFANMQATIIETINSKIEEELAKIKTQQEENRKFMEEKFAELFEKLNK